MIEARDDRLFDALRGRDGVLQQAIRGQEYTVDAIYDRDGRLVATSPRRRLRSAGVSTAGVVEPDARLHALAERLGRHWQFRYAINFQVVRDETDRDWLIELNPRLAGSAIFSGSRAAIQLPQRLPCGTASPGMARRGSSKSGATGRNRRRHECGFRARRA